MHKNILTKRKYNLFSYLEKEMKEKQVQVLP